MDVKCEKCKTEYSFENNRIEPEGTTVKCTECNHIFKVYPEKDETDVWDNKTDMWALHHTNGKSSTFSSMDSIKKAVLKGQVNPDDLLSKNGSPWRRLGSIDEVKPLFEQTDPKEQLVKNTAHSAGFAKPQTSSFDKTLHDNPLFTPETQKNKDVTRTKIPMVKPVGASIPGDTNKTLNDPHKVSLKTSSSDYQVDETIPASKNSPMSIPAGTKDATPYTNTGNELSGVTAKDTKVEPNLSDIPSDADEENWAKNNADSFKPPDENESEWDESESFKDAGNAKSTKIKSSEEGEEGKDDDIDDLTPSKRKIGRWIILGIFIIILGVVFYFIAFKDDVAQKLLSSFELIENESPEENELLVRGRKAFATDCETGFRRAIRDLGEIVDSDAEHILALYEMTMLFSVWTQHIMDSWIDSETDAMLVEENEKVSLQKESAWYKREFTEKLNQSKKWMNLLMKADADNPKTHLAAANVFRLEGKLDKAKIHLGKARTHKTNSYADYVEALIDLDSGGPKGAIGERLKVISSDTSLLRVMYRLARLYAFSGSPMDSKKILYDILSINQNHTAANKLLRRIEDKKPVRIALADKNPDETIEKTAEKDTSAPDNKTKSKTLKKLPDKSEVKPPVIRKTASVDSLLEQAVRSQTKGNTSKAIDLFEKVLESKPGNMDALNGLGYCYLDKHSYGRAISKFSQIIAANPSYSPALIGLAHTYKSKGQSEQALQYYKKYLSANPSGRQAPIAKRNIKILEENISKTENTDENKSDRDGEKDTSVK